MNKLKNKNKSRKNKNKSRKNKNKSRKRYKYGGTYIPSINVLPDPNLHFKILKSDKIAKYLFNMSNYFIVVDGKYKPYCYHTDDQTFYYGHNSNTISARGPKLKLQDVLTKSYYVLFSSDELNQKYQNKEGVPLKNNENFLNSVPTSSKDFGFYINPTYVGQAQAQHNQ